MGLQDFIIGQIYNRRRDIHEKFGGQRQGGISTPKRFPLVIAFTGASGKKHGYADAWTPEGTFRYFGEGQEGDMTLTAGNKGIANHGAQGKDLLLFETLGKGRSRFRGAFYCAGYSFSPAPDRLGKIRQAIVFELAPLDTDSELPIPKPLAKQALSLDELRRRAMAAAGPARQTEGKEAIRNYYVRSEAVRAYVLARSKGVCESCNTAAPFTTAAGNFYLEPHHIRRLTDGGPDDPKFMGAICPNCHREIHHGAKGAQLNSTLLVRVTAKEPG